MKMTRLEKMFVNRKKEAEKNIGIAEQRFSQIDLSNTKRHWKWGAALECSHHIWRRNISGI